MLPTLAGGSGVAAHALTDNDLLHVVDAETLNANRDRQMSLGELRTHFDTGATFEVLHNPATTGNQLLGTIADWNGAANGVTVNYATLTKDALGLFHFAVELTTPTAPASWTAAGNANIRFIAGSGSGTPLWDAFLAQIVVELDGDYGAHLAYRDNPPPLFCAPDLDGFPAQFIPSGTSAFAGAGLGLPAHTLATTIHKWADIAQWSDFVKPSYMMGIRLEVHTKIPA